MPIISDARPAADPIEHTQAEPSPSEVEGQFREMIDALPASIYTTDAQGRLTHFNRACVTFSGRTPNLGTDNWCVTQRLYHPNGTPMPHDECPMAIALKEGRALRGEQAIAERPDGTHVWFEAYPTPLRDSDGTITGGINMLVDITARKQAEERLRLSEEFLRPIMESSEDCIKTLDLEGRLLSMSDSGQRRLEIENLEALLGHSWIDFWKGSDHEAARCAVERAAAGERGAFVGYCPTFMGKPKWWDVIVTPIRDDRGRPERLLAISRDITDRKEAEAERNSLLARESEARSEAESLNDVARALSSLDLQSVLQRATDAATRLTGAKFGAFFHNVTDDKGESYLLYTLSGAPREAFDKFGLPRNTPVFAPTFRGEGVVRIEDVRADPRYGKNPPHRGMPRGHLPVRSYLAVPVVSSSGEVLGGIFFGHPEIGVFTERAERIALGIAAHAAVAIDNARLFRSVQEEIAERKQAEERLREADRRKDEFLAMLAHELRNPLAPIGNSVQIMRMPGIDGEVSEQARQTIERQVKHLVRLVDDLLDVSRISRNRIELRRERVALAVIVQSAVETSKPLIEASGQELTVELPAQTIWLNADFTRMAQVLANLLNNAAKYTPERARIRLTAERQGNEAVVRVQDTGIGIPRAMLPHIFEMFRQVDTSQERSQGGLGIGLTLVKNLVEMHGGTVVVDSAGAGRGSEFVVRLPIMEETPKASSETPVGELTGATPRRILIVDDNRDSADSLAKMLTLAGHCTQTAYDGLEAIEAASTFRPDVILLDIGLPKLNGYEVARQMRQQPWGRSAVLIALTGWGQDEDRSKSHEAGFNSHFVKPVGYAALTKLLAEAKPTGI
ncbi:MAG: PAS domain-containing protein [Gammaproteobacteria bacterium]